jgi:hypothetical protein
MASGRKRKPRVPDGMPVVAEAQGSERELLAMWFKERMDLVRREYEERIEILRTVGEHPSPIFANMVREHAVLGLEPKYIATLLCCSPSTVVTYYQTELDEGKAHAVVAISKNMMRIATSLTDPNNAKVGMQLLERRGGEEFKPATKKVEFEDTTRQTPVIDSSKLTYEERQQMRAMLVRIANGGDGEPLTPDEESPEI